MTKKELKQIYYLNKEIEMWKRELEVIESDLGYRSPAITGMPAAKTNLTSDPSGASALKNMEKRENIKRIINGLLAKIQYQREVIMNYILTIDDSLLRQITQYRCVSLMSWVEVANAIGGDNTADSVRMIFNRQFK